MPVAASLASVTEAALVDAAHLAEIQVNQADQMRSVGVVAVELGGLEGVGDVTIYDTAPPEETPPSLRLRTRQPPADCPPFHRSRGRRASRRLLHRC